MRPGLPHKCATLNRWSLLLWLAMALLPWRGAVAGAMAIAVPQHDAGSAAALAPCHEAGDHHHASGTDSDDDPAAAAHAATDSDVQAAAASGHAHLLCDICQVPAHANAPASAQEAHFRPPWIAGLARHWSSAEPRAFQRPPTA